MLILHVVEPELQMLFWDIIGASQSLQDFLLLVLFHRAVGFYVTVAGGDEGEQREALRHVEDIEQVTTRVWLNARSSLLVPAFNLQLGDEFAQRAAKAPMVLVVVQERHF